MLPHVLSLVVFVPLAAAVLIMVLRGVPIRTARLIATAAAAASFLAAVPLWFAYDPSGLTWQFTERVPLIGSLGFAWSLGVDGLGILLVLLVTFVTAAAFLVPAGEPLTTRTCIRVLILEAAVLAVFTALDLLLLCIAWIAAMAAAQWLLRSTAAPSGPGSRRFAWHAAGSSIALLAGVSALYAHVHSATAVYTFDLAQVLQLTIPADVQAKLFVAFFIAFAAVIPLFPFMAWIADAHQQAPAAARVLLAALLLKLGTYGFLRILLPLFPDASRTFAVAVTSLAAATIVAGVVAAFRQVDWRRAVAYGSAVYLAMSIVTMFRLTPAGLAAGMLQQADHGLLLAAVFAGGGWLRQARSATPAAADRSTAVNGRRVLAVVLAGVAVLGGWSVLVATRAVPSPAYRRIETAAGRVVARVNPAYAPVVRQPSDCGATSAPVTPSSSAPGGWVTSQPCDEPGAPVSKPVGK